MNILLAGGAGYIGSHAVVELVQRGHEVVIVDNLSNSSATVLERIKRITGKDVPFYEVDCANKAALQKVFAEHHFDAVMHFAGLKAVGESVSQPLRYYRNNIDSTLILCELMQEYGVKKLIFSSSATVYSASEELPLRETSQAGVGISNPTAAANTSSNKFCTIWPLPTRHGRSRCCAILTPSARTKAASLARIPMAGRTTYCRSSHK